MFEVAGAVIRWESFVNRAEYQYYSGKFIEIMLVGRNYWLQNLLFPTVLDAMWRHVESTL